MRPVGSASQSPESEETLFYRQTCVALLRISCLIALLCNSLLTFADNWPQWRGQRFTGISPENNLATRWSATENVAWRVDLPGQAGATPVVWDDRIYLTTANGKELQLWCFSTAGEKLWQRNLGAGDFKVRSDEGNMASPSPCTDGQHVWAMVGTGRLACFDRDGNDVWNLDVGDRYGEIKIAFGMSSTPVLDEGRLYLQLIHGDRNPATQEAVVVCLDASTGNEIWKQPRLSDAREECEHSYASPTLYRDAKHVFLITHGADYVVAHALDDGQELWRSGGLNPPGNYNETLRLVASPGVGDNLIVVPSAKGGPVYGIRPGGRGDISESKEFIAWRYPDKTPDVPSPLIHDGLVYLCRENGNLLCLNADTGEEYYHEKTVRDRHRASPVYADGKVYLTSRSGVVTVVRAGKEFEILAQNDLGEDISSSPVIADGTIYLRTFASLFAIRPGDSAAASAPK
ncbi:MAG: PQQ-binding-like beta-propeller repeat protein [Planctomycetales bacterium]|nr:PQQ-binding-like beta-propeller repeat protein [Planctomycetales bacterium]